MNRRNALKISGIMGGLSVFFYIASYFFFHYVTDEGISPVKLEEAGKPFVTNCIGTFATLCLFGALIFLLIGLICYKKDKSE